MTSLTFTRTEPPQWLLAFWADIDNKTFGRGFDCFVEDATCNLGVADWHGREGDPRTTCAPSSTPGSRRCMTWSTIGTAGPLKVFRGIVTMTPDDPGRPVVRPGDDAFLLHGRGGAFESASLVRSRGAGRLLTASRGPDRDEAPGPGRASRRGERMASPAQTTNELGALLRQWRDLRRKSQLDLSMDADTSQRHISFIESGPQRPEPPEAASTSPRPSTFRSASATRCCWPPATRPSMRRAPGMRPTCTASPSPCGALMRQHEPFPAVVMDRYWTVLMANDAAPRFFGAFVDLGARPTPRNLLHLIFDPPACAPSSPIGSRPRQACWRVSNGNRSARVVDAKTKALLAAVMAYPDVKAEWISPHRVGRARP